MNFAEMFIYICELLGTVAFAVSGSLVAAERGLDLFGIIFLGIITALGGGVIRDLLIGQIPPLFFNSFEFLMTAAVVSVVVFIICFFNMKRQGRTGKIVSLLIFFSDSVGLGVFSVTGVCAAIAKGYAKNPFLCIFIGMTTAIGGGVLRDMMTQQTPAVLRKHIYATAAISGSVIFYIMFYVLNINQSISAVACAVCVLAIRCLASYFKWSLPRVKK